MEHRDFRILGLAASLRRASFHRGIVRAAHEVAPEWMSCDSFDLGSIPYFNQDVEDQGFPEPVRVLREKVRTYDAVLIATPEYDYAIPGVLASALDWCLRSRHDLTPFRRKAVGIVGASPGGPGTARGQMVLRQILLHPPAHVMPEPQMLIPFSRDRNRRAVDPRVLLAVSGRPFPRRRLLRRPFRQKAHFLVRDHDLHSCLHRLRARTDAPR